MKKMIILLVVIATACGTKKEGNQFEELIAKRDSIKTEYQKLGKELRRLDLKIADLDSTRSHTLVTVINPNIETFAHYFDVRGNVETKKNTLIFPETPGNIKQINVEEGQSVKKGQVLIVLSTDVMQNQVKQLETSYKLAKTVFDKQEALYKQDIGSEIQYLEAKNNKESLEASLKSAKAQLDMLIINAPFDGIIDQIFPNIGSLASPGQPLIRIISFDNAYIEADVSEKYIGRIQKGTEVFIQLPTLEEELKASISYIGNFINKNNRTFRITVNLDNVSKKYFKPNMITVLKIRDHYKKNVIVLPAKLIQQDSEGKDFVYLADKNKNGNGNGSHIARKVFIKTGLSYKGVVEILSGLTGDENIIEKGSKSVKDGQKVKVI